MKNNAEEEKDSVEYELIVLDPKFESWLATQPPATFYSQQYYETWNQQYVTEWNHRHNNPLRYGSFYETYIDYMIPTSITASNSTTGCTPISGL